MAVARPAAPPSVRVAPLAPRAGGARPRAATVPPGAPRRMVAVWVAGAAVACALAAWTLLLVMQAARLGEGSRQVAGAATAAALAPWRPEPSALTPARQAELAAPAPRRDPAAAPATPRGARLAAERAARRDARLADARRFFLSNLGAAQGPIAREVPLTPVEGAPAAEPLIYRRRLD